MTDHIPVISDNAFNCPYCGAYTTQTWYEIFSTSLGEELPKIATPEQREAISKHYDDPQIREEMLDFIDRQLSGDILLFKTDKYSYYEVTNLHLSECYRCKKFSIWVFDELVYPYTKRNFTPNNDMPDDVANDFNEAASIVEYSPRGAAALLRLCVQKLCKFLGESGKNIDRDIAALVSKGLNVKIQQSLDIVRVIGNESVHPGEINLNDNKGIAYHLFELINLICDQMISQPKKIDEIYNNLPKSKLDAIEKRDAKEEENT